MIQMKTTTSKPVPDQLLVAFAPRITSPDNPKETDLRW